MNRRTMLVGVVAGVLGGATRPDALAQITSGGPSPERVADAERAFAATMARRDLAAFETHVADDAVFVGGAGTPSVLRGKAAVVERWRAFFTAPTAPFSWSPDLVQVLDSGTLALSSGPVHDPSGKLTGRFNSIWRLDADGRWRIIFDGGSPVCP